MFFSPLVLLAMLVLAASVLILFFVVQIGLIGYAFEKVGVPPSALFSLLLLSWLGSWVNLPLARLTNEGPMSDTMVVRFFGQRYLVPRPRRQQETVVAVNVGGAVVPLLLSTYLLGQALAPLVLWAHWWAPTSCISTGSGLSEHRSYPLAEPEPLMGYF